MNMNEPEEGAISTVRQRVLVIDDEPVVSLSIRRILAPEGFEVECATILARASRWRWHPTSTSSFSI